MAFIRHFGELIAHVHVKDYDGGSAARWLYAGRPRQAWMLRASWMPSKRCTGDFMVMAELNPDAPGNRADASTPEAGCAAIEVDVRWALGYRFRSWKPQIRLDRNGVLRSRRVAGREGSLQRIVKLIFRAPLVTALRIHAVQHVAQCQQCAAQECHAQQFPCFFPLLQDRAGQECATGVVLPSARDDRACRNCLI